MLVLLIFPREKSEKAEEIKRREEGGSLKRRRARQKEERERRLPVLTNGTLSRLECWEAHGVGNLLGSACRGKQVLDQDLCWRRTCLLVGGEKSATCTLKEREGEEMSGSFKLGRAL